MSKKRTAALGAGTLSVLLAGGIAFAPGALATEEDSAYALAAEGTLLNIDPVSFVSGNGHDSLANGGLPKDDPIISYGLLNAEASQGHAAASTAELEIALPGVPVIEAKLINADCTDLTGSVQIVSLKVGGVEQAPANQVPANTEIIPAPLRGIAKITLNEQVESEKSLTVTAIAIDALKGSPLGQSIDISSATCTAKDEDTPAPTQPPEPEPTEPPENGDGDEPEEDGDAPVPTPQPGHLDVTG